MGRLVSILPLAALALAGVAHPEFVCAQGLPGSVQVNVDAAGENIPGDAANEPSIAVDRSNPQRLAIGWRQFDTIASDFRQAGWGFSTDGGRTWTFPGVLEPGVFRSDPVLESDAAGNFYYYSLKVIGGDFTCDLFRSSDGGATWDLGVPAFGGDKAWMAIDRTGGIGDGNIYAAWDSFGCCGDDWFTRSSDGGETFDAPIPVPEQPIWGVTAVGPEGEVYVVGRQIFSSSSFVVARSTTVADPTSPLAFDGWSTVDLDGSVVFGQGPNPGGLLGQVWIAADTSGGPTDGNVYVLCSVDPPGPDPLDVHFARSTDGGLTWSTPIRVNDDPATNGAWQWFGTLSVAPDGRIDAIWNDTRADPGGVLSELYYSFSTDAGETWSPSEPVGAPFDPHVGWPVQEKIGDYFDMVSDLVGAHVAYAATYNDEQDVYYLRIGDYDCNGNGVGDADDIALGTSSDLDGNGIPDECQFGFRRGDANGDGSLDLSDAIASLAHLFLAAPVSCEDADDANDDGALDISDPVATLAHLFDGGPPPPPPTLACGPDPTADTLGCSLGCP